MKKIWKRMQGNQQWMYRGIGIMMLILFFGVMVFKVGELSVSGISDTMGIWKQDSAMNGYGKEIHKYFQNALEYMEQGDMTDKELIMDSNESTLYADNDKIIDEQEIGDWTYFRRMTEAVYGNGAYAYPALFRHQGDNHNAERVTDGACYSFAIAGDCVYYLDSSIAVQSHGALYASWPDGSNERLLEEELYDFQIVDGQYIYYTYCYDTVGVGLEGHALHRMNLDGSERVELDGEDDYWYDIERIEDGWIYYIKGGEKYKIRTDGSGKEAITE